jgi:hypothetical protein
MIFLQPPITSPLLGPIFFSAPCSEAPSPCVLSLISETKIYTYKTTGKIILLVYFPKVCLCDLLSVCRCSPLIKFWTPQPILMKAAMYIMAPEPISTAYYINPSHQSVCLYMYVDRQRLGKKIYCGNEYTRNNKRIVTCIVFNAIRVVWKETRRLVIPRTSCYILIFRFQTAAERTKVSEQKGIKRQFEDCTNLKQYMIWYHRLWWLSSAWEQMLLGLVQRPTIL